MNFEENTNLNTLQQQAVSYEGDAQNVLVIAGAGCGKTKTITERTIYMIKKKQIPPQKILMITFTNKAANEMRNRIHASLEHVGQGIQISTFHAFCLKIIKKLPLSFGIVKCNIIDEDDQKSIMKLAENEILNNQKQEYLPKDKILLRYYSYCRNSCILLDEYLKKYTSLSQYVIDICCKVIESYQKIKISKGYLDYDDLLNLFANKLEEKPQLKHDIVNLFEEILIDEMQDTNPLQMRILKHFSDSGVRLFCVGDPAQSIYGFRGAKVQYIIDFEKMFDRSTTLYLSVNYRSNQEILDVSNWLLHQSPLEYKNQLVAHNHSENTKYLPKIIRFSSAWDEAEWVAEHILDTNYDLHDIMILVRSSFCAKTLESKLISKKIPYIFIGGTTLIKSAHIRDILSLMRIINNERDDLAWMRFLQLWPGIGKVTSKRIVDNLYHVHPSMLLSVLKNQFNNNPDIITAYQETKTLKNELISCIRVAIKNLSPVMQKIYKDSWSGRKKDLDLLLQISQQYNDLSEFITDFTMDPMAATLMTKTDQNSTVRVSTIHSAKGTEAKICFIIQANVGVYPHKNSYGDLEQEEEERRVLYVALTRAKEELYITSSTQSHHQSFIETEGEEYFLANIPKELMIEEIQKWTPTTHSIDALQDDY